MYFNTFSKLLNSETYFFIEVFFLIVLLGVLIFTFKTYLNYDKLQESLELPSPAKTWSDFYDTSTLKQVVRTYMPILDTESLKNVWQYLKTVRFLSYFFIRNLDEEVTSLENELKKVDQTNQDLLDYQNRFQKLPVYQGALKENIAYDEALDKRLDALDLISHQYEIQNLRRTRSWAQYLDLRLETIAYNNYYKPLLKRVITNEKKVPFLIKNPVYSHHESKDKLITTYVDPRPYDEECQAVFEEIKKMLPKELSFKVKENKVEDTIEDLRKDLLLPRAVINFDIFTYLSKKTFPIFGRFFIILTMIIFAFSGIFGQLNLIPQVFKHVADGFTKYDMIPQLKADSTYDTNHVYLDLSKTTPPPAQIQANQSVLDNYAKHYPNSQQEQAKIWLVKNFNQGLQTRIDFCYTNILTKSLDPQNAKVWVKQEPSLNTFAKDLVDTNPEKTVQGQIDAILKATPALSVDNSSLQASIKNYEVLELVQHQISQDTNADVITVLTNISNIHSVNTIEKETSSKVPLSSDTGFRIDLKTYFPHSQIDTTLVKRSVTDYTELFWLIGAALSLRALSLVSDNKFITISPSTTIAKPIVERYYHELMRDINLKLLKGEVLQKDYKHIKKQVKRLLLEKLSKNIHYADYYYYWPMYVFSILGLFYLATGQFKQWVLPYKECLAYQKDPQKWYIDHHISSMSTKQLPLTLVPKQETSVNIANVSEQRQTLLLGYDQTCNTLPNSFGEGLFDLGKNLFSKALGVSQKSPPNNTSIISHDLVNPWSHLLVERTDYCAILIYFLSVWLFTVYLYNIIRPILFMLIEEFHTVYVNYKVGIAEIGGKIDEPALIENLSEAQLIRYIALKQAYRAESSKPLAEFMYDNIPKAPPTPPVPFTNPILRTAQSTAGVLAPYLRYVYGKFIAEKASNDSKFDGLYKKSYYNWKSNYYEQMNDILGYSDELKGRNTYQTYLQSPQIKDKYVKKVSNNLIISVIYGSLALSIFYTSVTGSPILPDQNFLFDLFWHVWGTMVPIGNSTTVLLGGPPNVDTSLSLISQFWNSTTTVIQHAYQNLYYSVETLLPNCHKLLATILAGYLIGALVVFGWLVGGLISALSNLNSEAKLKKSLLFFGNLCICFNLYSLSYVLSHHIYPTIVYNLGSELGSLFYVVYFLLGLFLVLSTIGLAYNTCAMISAMFPLNDDLSLRYTKVLEYSRFGSAYLGLIGFLLTIVYGYVCYKAYYAVLDAYSYEKALFHIIYSNTIINGYGKHAEDHGYDLDKPEGQEKFLEYAKTQDPPEVYEQLKKDLPVVYPKPTHVNYARNELAVLPLLNINARLIGDTLSLGSNSGYYPFYHWWYGQVQKQDSMAKIALGTPAFPVPPPGLAKL